MTALRQRLRADLPLRGLAPQPQPCSSDAGQHRAPPDRRAPAQLSEAALRQYCLVLRNEQQGAERTCRMHL